MHGWNKTLISGRFNVEESFKDAVSCWLFPEDVCSACRFFTLSLVWALRWSPLIGLVEFRWARCVFSCRYVSVFDVRTLGGWVTVPNACICVVLPPLKQTVIFSLLHYNRLLSHLGSWFMWRHPFHWNLHLYKSMQRLRFLINPAVQTCNVLNTSLNMQREEASAVNFSSWILSGKTE